MFFNIYALLHILAHTPHSQTFHHALPVGECLGTLKPTPGMLNEGAYKNQLNFKQHNKFIEK